MVYRILYFIVGLLNAGYAATSFTWNSTTTLSEAGSTFFPTGKIASNGTDSGTAIWSRYINGKWLLKTAWTANNGKTWSLPETDISFVPQIINPFPQIVINDSDTTIAVFNIYDDVLHTYNIQQAHSSDGGTNWTTSPRSLGSSVDGKARIDLQGEDQAIAVWSGPSGIIQGNYTSDGGVSWITTGDLSSSGAQNPQVAINITNQAVVAWEKGTLIQAKYSVDGGATWHSSDLSLTAAQNPQIVLNDIGMAICVCEGNNGTYNIIESSNSYDGGASWSDPQILSNTLENASNPKVSLNENGEAIVAWQSNNGAYTTIQSAYSLDGGYSYSPHSTISTSSENANDPSVSINGDGIGAVVFTNTTQNVIQACSTIDQGETFTAPAYISTSHGQSQNNDVVINEQDFALILWSIQFGSAYTVQTLYGNFFQVSLEQKMSKLLLQRDYVNIISCETIPEAFMYRVYADEDLTIPLYQGISPLFYDHGQNKRGTKTYYMTWSDEYDEESSPGVVTGP